MPYSYEIERPKVFTEDGQVMFLKIRDRARRLIAESGAVRCQELLRESVGDSWSMLACIDRLIELKEIREVVQPGYAAGQDRVYVRA